MWQSNTTCLLAVHKKYNPLKAFTGYCDWINLANRIVTYIYWFTYLHGGTSRAPLLIPFARVYLVSHSHADHFHQEGKQSLSLLVKEVWLHETRMY